MSEKLYAVLWHGNKLFCRETDQPDFFFSIGCTFSAERTDIMDLIILKF